MNSALLDVSYFYINLFETNIKKSMIVVSFFNCIPFCHIIELAKVLNGHTHAIIEPFNFHNKIKFVASLLITNKIYTFL